jgi:hypothetical protein
MDNLGDTIPIGKILKRIIKDRFSELREAVVAEIVASVTEELSELYAAFRVTTEEETARVASIGKKKLLERAESLPPYLQNLITDKMKESELQRVESNLTAKVRSLLKTQRDILVKRFEHSCHVAFDRVLKDTTPTVTWFSRLFSDVESNAEYRFNLAVQYFDIPDAMRSRVDLIYRDRQGELRTLLHNLVMNKWNETWFIRALSFVYLWMRRVVLTLPFLH